jgi:hypothetical protein
MRKRTIVIGGIVGLLAFAGCTAQGSGGAATTAPAMGVPSAGVAAPSSDPAAAEDGPLVAFGNGSFRIGQDVVAGRYRSPAPEEGIARLCYWDVQDDTGKILDQGVANDGPSIAKLPAGKLFTSKGCKDWQKV